MTEFVKCDGVTPWGSDPGAHYRHSIKVKVTAADLERGYVEAKVDPYRIAAIYDMRGGPREQIMKKSLRYIDKGQSEREVAAEIRSALDRWFEMLDEDEGLS